MRTSCSLFGTHELSNTYLVDLVRAVRDGDVPAFRTRPTVELCDLWFEQRAVVACREAHEEHTA